MIAWRILLVVVHLFYGLATSALMYPLTSDAWRFSYIQSWSTRLLKIFGLRVTLHKMPGANTAAQALIVSNHISWIDIFVINSIHSCRFVAKSDVRDWPLIGWLCHKAGTIFISRGKRSDVRRIQEDLVRSIQAGERVAFFPEGTTAEQGALLPFHANLFETAIKAQVPVQPYVLRYLDRQGNFHSAATYIGETTFIESMLSILRAGGIQAQLVALPPIDSSGLSRRELSRLVEEAMNAALGYRLITPADAGNQLARVSDPQAVPR